MASFGKQKWLWVTASVVTPSIAVALTTFMNGTTISAAAVNANFVELQTRITALEARAAGLTAIPTPVVQQAGAPATIPTNGSAVSVATCPAQTVVTGGGCTYVNYAGAQGAQNFVVNGPFSGDFTGRVASFTRATDRWTCSVEDAEGIAGGTFQAFAVCMPLR